MNNKLIILDTTLRDGEQTPGVNLNLTEKLDIARQLELLGVDVIEAGMAASNKADSDSIAAIAKVIKKCAVASLARAREADIDAAYNALKDAVKPRIHIVLSTSSIHIQYKLRMTEDEVLERATASVRYAKALCDDIQFSCEDATRSDRDYLCKILRAVIDAGATTVNIADTVGYTTPQEMYELIRYIKENVENIDKADIAVHCHNDLGMAVANTLAGIRAGATQAECTVNGIGERAGNASLEEVVMAVHTRKDIYNVKMNIKTKELMRTSKLVYAILGQKPSLNKPIVGANAFLHESGIHQHGVLLNRSTYEIMTPESIGINPQRMVLGKHSGKHAFEDRLKELGYNLDNDEIDSAFHKFKEISDKKSSVTDGDIEAIITNKELKGSVYKLEGFTVNTGKGVKSTSVIRLSKDKQMFEDVSLGDGPVDAAYNAIDKIAGSGECELETYTINSTSDGKDALGEVVVKLRLGDQVATGRGLSTDIIESSILAYINAINKLYY
jgi:2-isopropylmalate synthase